MSAHRRPNIPFTDAPRGSCRWCGDSILYHDGPRAGTLDRRRRWHPDCVAEYNLSDPREARTWLRRRQRGTCQDCGLDTYALRREVRAMKRGRAKRLRELGFLPRQSLWELDHIVPLIDGGTHERENLQTLCIPCHRKKSALEASARAERRRAEAPDAPLLQEPAHASASTAASAPPAEGVATGERTSTEEAAASAQDAATAETAANVQSPPIPAAEAAPPAAGAAAARTKSPRRSRTRGARPPAKDLASVMARADAANARAEALLAEIAPRRS